MKRFGWRWLAVSSVIVAVIVGALFGTGRAQAEVRPQYGGTLHISMRESPASLDPVESSLSNSYGRRSLTRLLFETLIDVDDSASPRGVLAVSWQQSGEGRRWQFLLRHGVHFHDGTSLIPEVVAASLRTANPSWKISVLSDSVVIEQDSPDAQLLAELALSRNAIAKRASGNQPSGTGAFHVADWQPGKKLTLAAEEGYWGGRPFLDGIEIEMGRNYREQIAALELGKVDLAEVAPEQVHRTTLAGRRIASSQPIELLALVFAGDPKTPEEKLLRESLALSVERGSIRSVLLQGSGQPTAGLLPAWMSGYGFVFPIDADLPRARHVREQVRTIPTWSIGYSSSDPIARLIAERITLNARDAGLSLQPTQSASADLQLVRIPLESSDPWIALSQIAARCETPFTRKEGASVEDLYAAEQTLLATQRIVPLFHLPVSYAASTSLKSWETRPDGSVNVVDSWMGAGNP
jgi:peptide/nickel transport system substrate-binding protein